MHTLIAGQTMSGKTIAAQAILKTICNKYKRPLLVLDPILSEKWEADFITDDPVLFLNVCLNNFNCEICVDEADEVIGKHAGDLLVLATRSRHNGHRSTFITHRATSLDPAIRAQCTTLYTFSQSFKDSQTLAEEFVADMLKNAVYLKKFQFYYLKRFNNVVKSDYFQLIRSLTK